MKNRFPPEPDIDHAAAAPGKEPFRNLPCALVLTGILSAVLPRLWFPELPAISALLPAAVTLLAWRLLNAKAAFFRLALPAFAAACSFQYQLAVRQNDPLIELLNGKTTAGIEAEIQIDDPSLCSDAIGLPEPKRIFCRVTAVRFSPADHWDATAGKVVATFPPGTKGLFYGSRFQVRGILSRPEPPLLPGEFDYGAYLARRNIHYTFRIRSAKPLAARPSLYRTALKQRDRLLRALTRPMPAIADRSLAAALLFGCRQGISRGDKTAFIRSGTIHILTVSGLHIGMFAGAVYLLLLFLPFRARMLLTPLLTLAYAFATGMRMPALRAVIMLFCWCVPRAFLLRGGGLNSVFLACSILLWCNPFQIQDAGFQYSFLGVFSLVLTAPEAAQWLKLIYERRQWIPDRRQSRFGQFFLRLGIRTASLLGGCLTAWLGAFALTLYYQGIVVTAAPLTNLLVIPAASLVFLVFTVAALPCLLFPALGGFFAGLLALPLAVIRPVCSSGAGANLIPVPPLWSVFCALALLFLLFRFSGKKIGIAALCGLLGLLFFWCLGRSGHGEPELLFLYGGRQRIPAIVVSVPREDFSCVLNAADFRTAATAAGYLKRRGHPDLTVLAAGGSARDFTGGAKYLFTFLPVRYYLTAAPPGRGKYAREALRAAARTDTRIIPPSGNRITWNSGALKITTFTAKNRFDFDISQNAFTLHFRIFPDATAGAEVFLTDNSARHSWKFVLPRQRERGFRQFALNR